MSGKYVGGRMANRSWRLFCQYLMYPLWDIKDGRGRLRELRSLMESQFWSAEHIQQLQLSRLRSIVDYAYKHCQFYRQHWQAAPRLNQLDDIRGLPLVQKSHIRDSEERFQSDEVARGSLITAKTGGSTGVALRVHFDELCQKKRNAAAMRTDRWAGWMPGSLTGALWGSPPIPRTLKEKIRNFLHDRIFYLDTMRLDATTMRVFAEQMRRRRPEMLFGHAHSLFIFARFLRDESIRPHRLDGIVSTSMVLLDNERRTIEEVFGCPVTNRYGCEEVGLIASECEVHEGMHLNAEHVLVEFLRDDDSWAAPGEEGRIVVTDLVNHGMPLIRYVIGDLGIPSNRRCSCGRGLPMMDKLTGRTADFLKRRDGSLVAGISLVEKTLTAIAGIEQLQIIQLQLDEFVLNVVPAPQFNEECSRALRQVILDVFGHDVLVSINAVHRLSQERNSKYRFSICKV